MSQAPVICSEEPAKQWGVRREGQVLWENKHESEVLEKLVDKKGGQCFVVEMSSLADYI